MSQENVDLVRSIYADWERGDHGSADWADREIEFVIADGPEPGKWTGLPAMSRAWRNSFLGDVEDIGTFAEGYRELDDERVLVPTRYSARGRASGVTVDARGAIIFYIGNGKVNRLVRYWDRDRALADLGLEE